ncbi:hypothetical protein BJY52DRAFT_1290172 [Lactarius psammicola]|nr:hypothetical protein BJY52DRAFT_1290172 [Lactarius psammicola]
MTSSIRSQSMALRSSHRTSRRHLRGSLKDPCSTAVSRMVQWGCLPRWGAQAVAAVMGGGGREAVPTHLLVVYIRGVMVRTGGSEMRKMVDAGAWEEASPWVVVGAQLMMWGVEIAGTPAWSAVATTLGGSRERSEVAIGGGGGDFGIFGRGRDLPKELEVGLIRKGKGSDRDQGIATDIRRWSDCRSCQNQNDESTYGGDGGSDDGGVEQEVGDVLGKDDDDADEEDEDEDSKDASEGRIRREFGRRGTSKR